MAEEEKKSDALLVPDLNMQGIGPALVQAAQQQEQDDNKREIVRKVQGIMADISRKTQLIANIQKSVEQQSARLKALNAGEFTIELNPDYGRLEIIYKDSALQVDIDNPVRQGPIFSGVVHR